MQLSARTQTQAAAKARPARKAAVRAVVVKAVAKPEAEMPRRAALAALAGVAALATGAAPSFAAYGDSANVFGKITNKSGFVPYAGEGFAILLPSKWNPSKEEDFGKFGTTVLRYEDNGDAVNNVVVLTQPTTKGSIDDFGAPDKFLESISFLFGRQSFAGETMSEGGFAPNRVAAASLLDISESTDKKGKKYYRFEIVNRTADGNEGGRHQLISASVSGGKLWICKVQIGDKRWIKGANKDAFGAVDSFTVA